MTTTTLPDGSEEPTEVFDDDIPAQHLLGSDAESGDLSAAVRFAFVEPQYLLPNSINRTFTDEELVEVCKTAIARYKIPKAFVRSAKIVRSPAGKADYRWAKALASESVIPLPS